MFPIPCLMLTTGNNLPLPPGVVKSVVSTWYTNVNNECSVAVLLNNGDLYTQGSNSHGELGDGTLVANRNTWFKTATNIKRVFGTSYSFVVEKNDGSWMFAGYQAGLTGLGGDQPNWTDLPVSITNNLPMTQIKDVHGGPGATMWMIDDGRMFGSGLNANGCVGQGSLTASYAVPVLIQNTVSRVNVTEARTIYLNSATGKAYVAGLTGNILGNGNFTVVSSFTPVIVPVGFFIEDFVSFGSTTILLGHMTTDPTKKVIYSVGILPSDAYTKETSTFGSGADTISVPPGYQGNFFGADGNLYAYGTGPAGTPDGNVNSVPMEPTYPFSGGEWDLSKVNQITLAPITGGLNKANGGHFLVYDNNLFFTGTSPLSQGQFSSPVFKNISQFNT